jgi:hypothetical protein
MKQFSFNNLLNACFVGVLIALLFSKSQTIGQFIGRLSFLSHFIYFLIILPPVLALGKKMRPQYAIPIFISGVCNLLIWYFLPLQVLYASFIVIPFSLVLGLIIYLFTNYKK